MGEWNRCLIIFHTFFIIVLYIYWANLTFFILCIFPTALDDMASSCARSSAVLRVWCASESFVASPNAITGSVAADDSSSSSF